ncbi:MAG: hypothetical protein Q8O37_14990 [Sulfuricellaceae bacterium]|nr:hypothetical protein [Sulfuricellaceae bacterium]
MIEADLATHFESKKTVRTTTTKADLLKKMTNLTPEQIAAIEAIVSKVES